MEIIYFLFLENLLQFFFLIIDINFIKSKIRDNGFGGSCDLHFCAASHCLWYTICSAAPEIDCDHLLSNNFSNCLFNFLSHGFNYLFGSIFR